MSLLVETRPAEIDSPSPDIAAEMFLLRFTGNTASAYRTDLRTWGRWLTELGISPFDADRNTIQLWVKGMQGRAPATVARRLACLSSFYTYLEQEGLVERSPLAGVRRPKGSGRPVSGLDRHELRSLLREAKRAGTLEYALTCLLALNGLRIQETLGLDVGDLGSERGFHTVVVRRKGNVQQRVPLADVTWQAVRQLIEEREEDETGRENPAGAERRGDRTHGGDAHSSARSGRHDDHPSPGALPNLSLDRAGAGVDRGTPLFTSPTGERLTRFTAFRIVRRLAAQAGVREISPHSLRHSYAQVALDGGAAIHDLQSSMAHSDPKTTMSYATAARGLDRNPTFVVAREVVE